MTKKRKEYYRGILSKRLNELQVEANKKAYTMVNEREKSPDPMDQAAMESNIDYHHRMWSREFRLIAKVREALRRIEDGTFGVCKECGEDISEQRLRARPVTTLCIECKREQEMEERVKGL